MDEGNNSNPYSVNIPGDTESQEVAYFQDFSRENSHEMQIVNAEGKFIVVVFSNSRFLGILQLCN